MRPQYLGRVITGPAFSLDNSNENKVIRHPENHRCLKIIATDHFVHP